MVKKQYVVLGLGVFGSTIAKTLAEYGYEVLAIDQDLTCVERIAPYVAQAVQADMTNIEQLRLIGVGEFDVAIIGTGSNLENSLLAIIHLRELGIPYIIAKARNKSAMMILEKVGADQVIRPEKEMGERVAKSLMSNSIVELFDIDENYSVVELKGNSEWIGKSLRSLDLRSRLGINVIGVKRPGDSAMNVITDPDYVILADDHLMAVAETGTLEKIDYTGKRK